MLQALTILHRRLEYLRIDAVGVTELNIVCYNLQTLSGKCKLIRPRKKIDCFRNPTDPIFSGPNPTFFLDKIKH